MTGPSIGISVLLNILSLLFSFFYILGILKNDVSSLILSDKVLGFVKFLFSLKTG
jgi:hypothetical protein